MFGDTTFTIITTRISIIEVTVLVPKANGYQRKWQLDLVITYSGNDFTLKDFPKHVICAIISTGFSHKFLEDIEVCCALYCLNPLVEQYLPSPSIIKMRVEAMAIKAEEVIWKSLPAVLIKVLVALDCWSGDWQQRYLNIKAYWISREWVLENATLAFWPLYDCHTGNFFY